MENALKHKTPEIIEAYEKTNLNSVKESPSLCDSVSLNSKEASNPVVRQAHQDTL